MLVLEDVEFLSLRDRPTKGLGCKLENAADKTETLSRAYTSYQPFSVQTFVEGMLEYNTYQQVCRLLGFMMDCNKVLCKRSGGSGNELIDEGCTCYVLWEAMRASLNRYGQA